MQSVSTRDNVSGKRTLFEASRSFSVHLGTSIQEPCPNPEKFLHEKILNEKGYLLTKRVSQVQEYASDAIAVESTDMIHRQYDIRIVNGPSGSGKTVFAINRLAFVDNDYWYHERDEKMAVCVYYSLRNHSRSSFTPQTFKRHVEEVLQEALERGSDGKWRWEKYKYNKLNMRVSLILDEAGVLANVLRTTEVWREIYNEIEFCANFPRLILVGTGYDTNAPRGPYSTNAINTYRMKPWTEKNLASVAQMRYPEKYDGKQLGKRLVEEIGKYPLLKRLTTNARAAVFTLDAVKQLQTDHPTINLWGSIGTVIQMVLGRYTEFNGIAKLTDRQRKALAYAVFHELNLNNISTKPRFPEFTTISTLDEGEQDMIKRQAQGVVDLHVNSFDVDGEIFTSFVDDDSRLRGRSMSITPAMSMLLYNLLGVDATIYDNWEGLAATTALHAAYLEVLNNKTTQELGVEIVRLTKALPLSGTTNKRSIYIPSQVTTPTVFVNGDSAPFFDVITKFRGLLAKHTENGEMIDLYLGEEMQKYGLLKERLPDAILTRKGFYDTPIEEDVEQCSIEEVDSEGRAADAVTVSSTQEVEEEPKMSKNKERMVRNGAKAFTMGNATLAAFLHTWNHDGTAAPPSNDSDAKECEGASPRFVSPAFCFPTSGRVDEKDVPSLHFTVDKEGSVMLDDRMIDRLEFSETRPFEMIIVTNARQMRLLPEHNGNAIVIDDKSVDANGVLTSEEPDGYDEYLKALRPRENVHVRFMFTGHQN